MARARKSVLKQKAVEPKIEVKEAPLFEVKNKNGDTVFAVNEETPKVEETQDPVIEKEIIPEPEVIDPVIPVDWEEMGVDIVMDFDKEPKPKERTLESLSKAEYRFFQRTGQMPK